MNVYKVTPKIAGVALRIVAQDEEEALEISGYPKGSVEIKYIASLEKYLRFEGSYQ